MATSRFHRRCLALIANCCLFAPVSALADVSVSSRPTANMACDAGVCTATAKKAVLNVAELTSMLASGDVAVKTGMVANDIAIDQALSWTSAGRLTLDARQSVIVNKQVTVAGQGGLTVTTNNSGQPKSKSGEFVIVPERGRVQFWDKKSDLIINGQKYKLVNNIQALAFDISFDPSGFYALAKPYDAAKDGTYSSAVVPTTFLGVFEGLGNTISGLSFNIDHHGSLHGLFARIDVSASVRDLSIAGAAAKAIGDMNFGLLAGNNNGTIVRCRASGTMKATVGSAGGLVGANLGKIESSAVNIRLSGSSREGGLVGYNAGGEISSSYALGSVALRDGSLVSIGGLVGLNTGIIENSYALNRVKSIRNNNNTRLGGLVGTNEGASTIENSYAAGEILFDSGFLGGLIGEDQSRVRQLANTYWDLDKGVSDPSQGAGNIDNDPGITGLTDAQLKTGLPDGFDPKIWAIDPKVNDGYPYLLANPTK